MPPMFPAFTDLLRNPLIKSLWLTTALTLCSPTLLAQPRKEPAPKKEQFAPIAIWLRAPGNHRQDKNLGKISESDLNLMGLEFTEITAHDNQYNTKKTYRGLYLDLIVRAFGADVRKVDAALLHFKNGMIIPLRSNMLSKMPGIFVALAVKKDGQFSTEFPDSIRVLPGEKDKKPLKFNGNKIVVDQSWAEKRNEQGQLLFNPWLHATSLKGIEFVNAQAYYAQFRPEKGDDNLNAWVTFQESCQFCHSVGGVGAHMGPDFLQPGIVATLSSKDLWTHVAQKKDMPQRAQLRMPHQVDFTLAESRSLLGWIKYLENKPLKSYTPPNP